MKYKMKSDNKNSELTVHPIKIKKIKNSELTVHPIKIKEYRQQK